MYLQVYIPSGLVVLIACLSFWIDQNAVPARITLGLVSVVTIATQVRIATRMNETALFIITARNSSCGKVIFSVVSVYFYTGGVPM